MSIISWMIRKLNGNNKFKSVELVYLYAVKNNLCLDVVLRSYIQSLVKQKRWKEVVALLSVEDTRRDVWKINSLAYVYFKMKCYNKVLELNERYPVVSSNVRFLRLLSLIYLKLGNYDQAMAEFSKKDKSILKDKKISSNIIEIKQNLNPVKLNFLKKINLYWKTANFYKKFLKLNNARIQPD